MVIGLTDSFAQQYRVSLLTCDPGEEIYSSFGHSAIRVLDQETGRDRVYNYGTFDFGAPNFVLNFAGGRLDYFLSVSTFDRFIAEYNYFHRSVREQELDLNQEQKLALIAFLETNYLPENRNYRYDFFFDNCATRIRDVMEEILGNQLVWHDEEQEAVDKSFRQLIDEKVFYMPWSDLGIDLALGSRLDRDATPREEQFLPEYMEEAFARAMIEGDGPTRPLVKNERVILDFQPANESLGVINPYLLFWILAIVFTAITFIGFRKKKLYIGFDLVFFGILGIIGLVMTALWLGSDIPSTKWNWNILWAFPGHLILIPGLLSKTLKPWLRPYLLFALILADAAVVFWILGWQSFHPSLIPLLLVIILRTNYLYYNVARYKLGAA
ncbi:Lnb N-terminal periplasmic domain-containing protein [Algoriphagus iocasae]